MHWQRQFLHPMLKAFDAPTREECTAERPRSNTPLAALVLLNDPSFVEASRAFAARIIADGGDDMLQRLTFAFRAAASRSPDELELQTLSGLAAIAEAHYRQHPEEAAQLLEHGNSPVPDELDPVALATWTNVARVILSLNEVTTRN
jgi:Protein of unknown function (DUF1553)